MRPTTRSSATIRSSTRRARRARSRAASSLCSASTRSSSARAVLGKPADAAEAEQMLETLAGKTHEVVSGLCLRTPAWEELHAETTAVTFRPLTARDVASYLATNEWKERAGSYAIQGVGAGLVERIEGDYLNVVGLPAALLDPPPSSTFQWDLRIWVARLAAREMGFLGYLNGFGGRDMAVDLRDREHARLRARARHRPLGAVRGRDRPRLRRGPRRRRRGEADARPDAGDDLRDPPAQGRRHRRFRRHGADAAPLHPEGASTPVRASRASSSACRRA